MEPDRRAASAVASNLVAHAAAAGRFPVAATVVRLRRCRIAVRRRDAEAAAAHQPAGAERHVSRRAPTATGTSTPRRRWRSAAGTAFAHRHHRLRTDQPGPAFRLAGGAAAHSGDAARAEAAAVPDSRRRSLAAGRQRLSVRVARHEHDRQGATRLRCGGQGRSDQGQLRHRRHIAPDLVATRKKVSGKPGAAYQFDFTISGDFRAAASRSRCRSANRRNPQGIVVAMGDPRRHRRCTGREAGAAPSLRREASLRVDHRSTKARLQPLRRPWVQRHAAACGSGPPAIRWSARRIAPPTAS